MRLIRRYWAPLLMAAALLTGAVSCMSRDVFYEDGEWDSIDYREGSDRMLQLGEMDADDIDR